MERTNAARGETAASPHVILRMLNTHWAVQIMSDVARLGVFDLVQARGPLTAHELTADGGVPAHPDALHRALRACAAVGLLTEDVSGRFGLTAMSSLLTSDHPASLRKLVELHGGLFGRIWTGLGECLRTGEPQVRAQLGMDLFEYLGRHPDAMREFGDAMTSYSTLVNDGLIASYDFGGIGEIVDVGGGFGHLTVALVERYPHLRGIVFDRPEVIEAAPHQVPVRDASVRSRIDYVAGDMFEDVPPADAYVLKMIVHDWDDERARAILRTCARRLAPGGRLLCVEAVLPEVGDTADVSNKLLDVHMLLTLGGRERTRSEWETLCRSAGLMLHAITAVPGVPGTCAIDARPA